MSNLREILEKPVVIDFKEDGVPGLRGGKLEHFCLDNLEQAIKQHYLGLIETPAGHNPDEECCKACDVRKSIRQSIESEE